MRKVAVVWYDADRNKYRVGMGKGQKTHVGRYATEEIAKAVAKAVTKAYWTGWHDKTMSMEKE